MATSFSQNLTFLRTQAGMTQEQLAEILSVSRQSVSKWESGASKPDLDNLAKAAADALNGLAYRDDSCITDLVVRKRYGTEPRLEVVIRDAAEPAPVEIQPEKREEEWF